MRHHPYTDVQREAFREPSNIAVGTAATSLSRLLGREAELPPSLDLLAALGLAEHAG